MGFHFFCPGYAWMKPGLTKVAALAPAIPGLVWHKTTEKYRQLHKPHCGMNYTGCGAKVDIIQSSLHHFQWILLEISGVNKLPASVSDFSSVKAVYREAYGNSIWSKARNKRAYFPWSGEESSKPLGHVVETTIRTVKPFLELQDQEENKKKKEEKELLNWVCLRRALIKGNAWMLGRHSSLSSRELLGYIRQGTVTGAAPVLISAGAAFQPGMPLFPICKMVRSPYKQNLVDENWVCTQHFQIHNFPGRPTGASLPKGWMAEAEGMGQSHTRMRWLRALHLSLEQCKVIPKFLAAKQSSDTLLLYKHRHLIREHQEKLSLCFALNNKKGISQNKQKSLLLSLTTNVLVPLGPCSHFDPVWQMSSAPTLPFPSPTWRACGCLQKSSKREKERNKS